MTLSFWRFAHLALAVFSFIFLFAASATGIFLAYDAVQEKSQPYKSAKFESLSLGDAVFALKQKYSEINEVNIDHNGFVLLEGMNENGDNVKIYVDPATGKELGKPVEKSELHNWVLSLHRSLFLKETGRFAVGVVSAILVLITFSGIFLIIKRQKNFRHFFDKIKKDHFAQYFHVISGRLFLIPILLISLTATFLFLERFEIIPKGKNHKTVYRTTPQLKPIDLKNADFFKNTRLSEVKKIQFPFIEDDEEEFYTVKLSDREVVINQITGAKVSEEVSSWQITGKDLSLDLHTGRGNIFLAVILGLSSISIITFIISGFLITFKRSKNKIHNKFSAENAEIILLFGSENGSTLGFASKIHQQLLSEGKKSFLTAMNRLSPFPKAQQLVVFTSTYGLGDAPSNADQFENKLKSIDFTQKLKYSVVGFGSKSYDEFCAFAVKADHILAEKSFERILALATVNDRSTSQFAEWAKAWSAETLFPIATAPSVYSEAQPKLKKFEVVAKTATEGENQTIKIVLKPKFRAKFSSGDLLAIYPDDSSRERFYSVGKVDGKIQLIVKVYENGFGSGFLNQLKNGETLKAKLIKNGSFHLPAKKNEVAMIANGTGIAPFLGMIDENIQKTKIHLYCGFRKETAMTKFYDSFSLENQKSGKLISYSVAFSREKDHHYVMDLVQRDEKKFIKILTEGGTVMICGSLKMQHDVENTLRGICSINGLNYENFKNAGQILTDCY